MATNKTTLLSRVIKLLAGVQKRFPTLNLPNFPIGGSAYTLVQIVGLLQPVVDAGNGAIAAKTLWQKTVQAERDANSKIKDFLVALRQAVYTYFGNQPDALGDFGLSPRKTRKSKTAAQRVVQAAKNAATRKARNTVGKKKKLEIKGEVSPTIEVSAGPVPRIVEPPPGNAPQPQPSGGNGAATAPTTSTGGSTQAAQGSGSASH